MEFYNECLINNQGSVIREMWLHELVTLFSAYNNYNETLNCPYTDINTSNYYNDIVFCYNYGVLDEVTEFNPTENASREFIAHTTNYFIGFLNDENIQYTFNEFNDVTYPEDIQVLINRNWLSCMENGDFS